MAEIWDPKIVLEIGPKALFFTDENPKPGIAARLLGLDLAGQIANNELVNIFGLQEDENPFNASQYARYLLKKAQSKYRVLPTSDILKKMISHGFGLSLQKDAADSVTKNYMNGLQMWKEADLVYFRDPASLLLIAAEYITAEATIKYFGRNSIEVLRISGKGITQFTLEELLRNNMQKNGFECIYPFNNRFQGPTDVIFERITCI